MGASQSTANCTSSAAGHSGWRTLIHCLAMAALFMASMGSVASQAQERHRIPNFYMPPDTSAQWRIVIPTPQYLPAGYHLFRVFREPLDGFNTGKGEIEFDYADPKCGAGKTMCPLQIFVSPMTVRPFSGTVGRTAESLSLWIGNRPVEAEYFIGNGNVQPQGEKALPNNQQPQPEPNDYNSNLNSLVFPFDGFMIGMRGSKLGGVGRAELIRVAKSLTYTVRP